MPAWLIKNMPPPLHDRLRQRAAAHHRSMNREAIAILERELERPSVMDWPPPVKPTMVKEKHAAYRTRPVK